MTLWKKALSTALTATMLASLLATAAASSVLAATVTVSSGTVDYIASSDSVPADGASTIVLTFSPAVTTGVSNITITTTAGKFTSTSSGSGIVIGATQTSATVTNPTNLAISSTLTLTAPTTAGSGNVTVQLTPVGGGDAVTDSISTFTFTAVATPTVTINQAAGQVDPTNTSPINFTVVFSAAVTGFATGDVTISGTAGGTKVGTVTGSGTTYNVAVSGMTTGGTVIATIGASVATATSGGLTNQASTSSDNTVTWNLGPTVTINQAAGQADPTSNSPINFTVVFSATVTGFATGDVTISGTAGGTKVGTITGSGTTYNVAVSGMTTGGTVTATIAGGVAINASSQGNAASTSTDNTVTWTPVPASITLTTSAPIPPGAQNPVILWGQGFTLGVQFGTNGANRTFQLQGTRDGLTWTTITTLTTDASGRASLFYTPVTNLFYRAVFAGAPDLAAANSNQVRTVVRQLAILRPTNSGSTRTIDRNTSITFSTTVRPARPELALAKVSFLFYRYSSGAWRFVTRRDVFIDSAGLARTTFTFTSSGQWYVRSQANPTPYNANSVMTPVERYSVR